MVSMQLIFDVIQYFSNLVSRNNFGDEAEQAHREREREALEFPKSES